MSDRDGHGDVYGLFGGDGWGDGDTYGTGYGKGQGCGWEGSTCGDGDSNVSDYDRRLLERGGSSVHAEVQVNQEGLEIHKLLMPNKTIKQDGKMEEGLNIVVLDRGFVYIGRVTVVNGWVHIEGAYNIRRWGTTDGLGQLVSGPTERTILDRVGTVKAPLHALIHLIPVSEEAWKSYYS